MKQHKQAIRYRSLGSKKPGKMLSIDQAAEAMGLSPFTLRAWIRERRISFHKLGRRIVIDPRDIERFLESNRVEARTGAPR